MIYKIESQGDAVYVKAESEEIAKQVLYNAFGKIPAKLLTISVVDKVPKGEELL